MCDYVIRAKCSCTNLSRKTEEWDREGEVPTNFMRRHWFLPYCSRVENLEASQNECVNLAEIKRMDRTQSITGSVSLKFRWMIVVRYPWWSKKIFENNIWIRYRFENNTSLKTIFELESISAKPILEIKKAISYEKLLHSLRGPILPWLKSCCSHLFERAIIHSQEDNNRWLIYCF